MSRLTDKQQVFVHEYLIDMNATQAAIRAGYKNTGSGPHLMQKDHVSRAIKNALSDRASRLQMTADYVLEQLKTVVERCLQHEPVVKWNPETRKREPLKDDSGKALYQFDSNGANRALELIGKHLGMFDRPKDKDITANEPVEINVIDMDTA
jgi:phage terminase small subunit